MRYFLTFIAAIALIVIVFILILRGLGSNAPENTIDLLKYADTDTVVQLTVDGPIDANVTHDRFQITVGRELATVMRSQGYDNTPVASQSYPNTKAAYASFLRSLQLAGFTKGDPNPVRADERGECSDGSRFIYEIIDGNNKKLERFWSTTCGKGTYGGDSGRTRNLFILQIPDASKLLRDIQY